MRLVHVHARSIARFPAARAEHGFTLIEVLVVVAILGLLATLVATNVSSQHEYALLEKARIDVRGIADAANVFRIRNRRHPTWEELVTPDAAGRPWIEASLDPWGESYALLPGDPQTVLKVCSCGPDRQLGTEDDVFALSR